jgi:hypothetical protein
MLSGKKKEIQSFLFVVSIFIKFYGHRRSRSSSDINWMKSLNSIYICTAVFSKFCLLSSTLIVTLMLLELYLMVTNKTTPNLYKAS